MLTKRVNRITLSPTLRISAKAQEMRKEGIDIVDFSVGEPDFPTPEAVKKAGIKAIEENFTKYVANDGIPDLKAAIIEKLERENSIVYKKDEIIVSPGAKNCLMNLASALYEEGDDALIPTPCWVSYPDQVKLSGANPVFIPTYEENGFLLQPKDLEHSITPNTKALLLNYPCNPTGAVYSRDELQAIADICVKEKIWIISDEIYEKLIYDGRRFTSIASLGDKVKSQTIVINGFSKAYSMTGWRLGYAAGPKEIIAACAKIQSHNTSNATSFVQKAGIVALKSCSMEVERMRNEFERRRNFIVNRLRAIDGVSVANPGGAFYVMPNIERYLAKEYGGAPIRNTYGLSYYLLKEAHTAVIPGEAFSSPSHVRLSFATSMEKIQEGVKRIQEALMRLETPKRLKPRAINNVITKIKTFADTKIPSSVSHRNELLALAENNLPADSYFEWNAAIMGAVVQLRTNSPHLADFYQENFFPAPLESEIEPHAIIYGVKDIAGLEPQAYISRDTSTGFLINSAFYGQIRELALSLAAETAFRTTGSILANCAAIDIDGKGALIWGGVGTGRTSLLAGGFKEEGTRFVSNDYVQIRPTQNSPLADLPERKFYLKAKWIKEMPALEKFYDKTKLENFVGRREDCGLEYCPLSDSCILEKGGAACALASKHGRMIIDPFWLGGTKRHVRRTNVKAAVLLVKDPVAPLAKEISSKEFSKMLADGGRGQNPAPPFFDNIQLKNDLQRLELYESHYAKTLSSARCVILNTHYGSKDAAFERIREFLR
jgi:aspartate/methionine/tyrosine aminotransferase